jgi:hypothetical protein
MKKIMAALIIVGFTYSGAQAQTAMACGTKNDKVCRLTAGKQVSCYKTKFAENYKVCQGNMGYYICCETPNSTNSTHTGYILADKRQENVREYDFAANTKKTTGVDMSIPQSQSYVMESSNAYEGYYPKRDEIRVCYTGDNVAEENRNPYNGCPSPAYDGPDANRQRNLNVNNPAPMPPLAGQRY